MGGKQRTTLFWGLGGVEKESASERAKQEAREKEKEKEKKKKK